MRRPLQHHISAPSVPIPQSDAAPSHIRKPSPSPMTIPTFQLGSKFIWYTSQAGPIGHPVARGRGPLHSGQACAFFLFHNSSLSLTPRTEELPRNKKEASCRLTSTSQYSYHATTQWSSTKHTIIITATTSNHFRCPWHYWSDRNSLSSSYHRCWMAHLFRGLDLLHAHSERRRSPFFHHRMDYLATFRRRWYRRIN
jgi:hypothetical protein